MRHRIKNMLAIAGIVGVVFGIVGIIPGFLKENYLLAIASTLIVMAGLISLAISFGD